MDQSEGDLEAAFFYAIRPSIVRLACMSTQAYTYDTNGNILTIKGPDNFITSYAYDKHHQLIRENDQRRSNTFTYTYDIGGNLTCVKEYAYIVPSVQITTQTPVRTVSAVMAASGWKDCLASWDGETLYIKNRQGHRG